MTKLDLQLQVSPDVFIKQGFHLVIYFSWLLIIDNITSMQAQVCLVKVTNQKLITSCKGESAVLSVELLVYSTVSGLVLGKNLVGADTSVASQHTFYYNCIL